MTLLRIYIPTPYYLLRSCRSCTIHHVLLRSLAVPLRYLPIIQDSLRPATVPGGVITLSADHPRLFTIWTGPGGVNVETSTNKSQSAIHTSILAYPWKKVISKDDIMAFEFLDVVYRLSAFYPIPQGHVPFSDVSIASTSGSNKMNQSLKELIAVPYTHLICMVIHA